MVDSSHSVPRAFRHSSFTCSKRAELQAYFSARFAFAHSSAFECGDPFFDVELEFAAEIFLQLVAPPQP
jgi:hypothetical protein